MKKNKIAAIKSQFDTKIHILEETDVEYWLARELMPLLGYERWENFEKAIKRSMESVILLASQSQTIFVRSRKWFSWGADRSATSGIICSRAMPVT